MTISNGSLIEAADLYNLQSTTNVLKTADGALPGVWTLAQSFIAVVASTPEYRRTFTFVCPNDVLLETLAVTTGAQTAGSVCTATLTSDGGSLAAWPVVVTGTTSTGLSRVPRLLLDNTVTNMADSPTTTARIGRTMSKGQTLTLTVATSTNVNTTGVVNVVLFGRIFHSRS